MENTHYIALSRQAVLRRQLDSVATNLANMNTSGYKAEKLMFTDWMSRNGDAPFKGEKRLHFVQDISDYRDTRQGSFEVTNRELDVAINNDTGYFVVQTPNGERYTRNGNFHLDSGGQLTTSGGFPVLTEARQPIFFTEADQNVEIKGDGTIVTDTGPVGRLAVVEFENQQEFTRIGNSLFETEQEPTQMEQPGVVQGTLEDSNVNAIVEMTQMIEVLRQYQSINRANQKEDERIKQAIQQLTRDS